MIVRGMPGLNAAEMPKEVGDKNLTDNIDEGFLEYLEEMQNRGMANPALTLLPGGKLQETIEQIKNMNFEFVGLPGMEKIEEDSLAGIKNKPLEDLKAEQGKIKLESSELFLEGRDLSKMAGKNQNLATFGKIFNLKKDAQEARPTEDNTNILSLMENQKEVGEKVNAGLGKTDKIQFGNTKELFNWISQIIAKNSISSGKALNLSINDGALGQFNIMAQAMQGNGGLNMRIIAQSEKGMDFFQNNENQLMKSLEMAGLKVSDFRVQLAGSDNSLKNDLTSLINDSREAMAERAEENIFQREDLNEDSRRRQEIWNKMKEYRERGA